MPKLYQMSLLLLLSMLGAGSISAAEPIMIEQGEYRLGESPQTPEEGLAWLTVDADSRDWIPYNTVEGHSADPFTNVWRRYRLPDTAVAVVMRTWETLCSPLAEPPNPAPDHTSS